jgi:hypothetical protein
MKAAALTVRRKRLWIILFWLLVPLILWWALRDIRPAEVWGTLSRISLGRIALLISLDVGIFMLISGRWWLILHSLGYRLPYLSIASYRLASYGISYFTLGPQIGGEPAQVYFIHRYQNVPLSSALASVSLDKILELLANSAFLMTGVFSALRAGLFLDLAPVQALLVLSGLTFLLGMYTLALWRGKTPLTWGMSKLPFHNTWIVRFRSTIASAEEQISLFCRRKPLAVFLASCLSLAIWIAMLAEYWFVLDTLGLRFNAFQVMVAMVAALVAFLFPLPGGLGALEASQVLAMEALGADPAIGISISLVIRARDVLIAGAGILLGGLIARKKSPAPLAGEIVNESLSIEGG